MKKNMYIKTTWRDHIVDSVVGTVIQEGTRHTATRMNNLETGIFDAHELLLQAYSERQRMKIEIEMLGRVKESNGTFFDALDGQTPKQLARLTAVAISQVVLSAGATSIKLDSVPFKAGEYVTVYDDEQQESVKITTVTATGITIPALVQMYKKGARVARTNATLDTAAQRIAYGVWGNYSISMMEVV